MIYSWTAFLLNLTPSTQNLHSPQPFASHPQEKLLLDEHGRIVRDPERVAHVRCLKSAVKIYINRQGQAFIVYDPCILDSCLKFATYKLQIYKSCRMATACTEETMVQTKLHSLGSFPAHREEFDLPSPGMFASYMLKAACVVGL